VYAARCRSSTPIGGVRGEGKGEGERDRHRCKGVFDFMLSSVAGKVPSLQARMYTQSGGIVCRTGLGL